MISEPTIRLDCVDDFSVVRESIFAAESYATSESVLLLNSVSPVVNTKKSVN
jgi:hypothetical protein